MAVSSTKKSTRSARTAKTNKRRKSLLTTIGDEAMRRALLEALVQENWALNKVAERLRLGGSGNVLRAIKQFNLTEAYEAARVRGDIKPGPRSAG
jgi:hypothetical protein